MITIQQFLQKLVTFVFSHKWRVAVFSSVIFLITIFLTPTFTELAKASFATWGNSSMIHACKNPRGGIVLVPSTESCDASESQVTWLKDVDAGVGLDISRDSSGAILSLQDGGVTTDKIATGSVTFNRLAANARNYFYTLTLGSNVSTTSNATATFGTINLPVESNVCIHSMWVLQNNDSAKGITAILVKDSTEQNISGDVVPFSAAGIGYTIARNHCMSNVSAGNHTFGVKIDQFPFESGKEISVRTGSVMWITATPTGN